MTLDDFKTMQDYTDRAMYLIHYGYVDAKTDVDKLAERLRIIDEKKSREKKDC